MIVRRGSLSWEIQFEPQDPDYARIQSLFGTDTIPLPVGAIAPMEYVQEFVSSSDFGFDAADAVFD